MTKISGPSGERAGLRNCWTMVLVVALAAAACSATAAAQAQVKFDRPAYESLEPADSGKTIPPGTRITLRNWMQYRSFMPVGLQALFSGNYPWKIGSGPEYAMEVGPTVPIPLSRKYRADTEKYSGQVRLKKLSTGGYTIENYVAGVPFPDPTEPELAIKLFPHSPFVFELVYASSSVDKFNNSTHPKGKLHHWRI